MHGASQGSPFHVQRCTTNARQSVPHVQNRRQVNNHSRASYRFTNSLIRHKSLCLWFYRSALRVERDRTMPVTAARHHCVPRQCLSQSISARKTTATFTFGKTSSSCHFCLDTSGVVYSRCSTSRPPTPPTSCAGFEHETYGGWDEFANSSDPRYASDWACRINFELASPGCSTSRCLRRRAQTHNVRSSPRKSYICTIVVYV